MKRRSGVMIRIERQWHVTCKFPRHDTQPNIGWVSLQVTVVTLP